MRLILLIACVVCSRLYAQDTLTLMHYNLMYYDENTSNCTSTNNNVNDKNNYLKTIFAYLAPDILTVNEMGRNMSGSVNTSPGKLLNSVLNTGGVNYFKRAGESGTSNLVNMVYYNSNKVELMNHVKINNDISGNPLTRTIDLYTFYHKAPDLAATNDTVTFTCIVAHLKAGNTQSDQDERAGETAALMSHLNQLNIRENRLFMGDFNVQSSTETAFNQLVSEPNLKLRFYDPLNQLGTWYSNSSYKGIHTQSTHLNTVTGDCWSSGGMDDRFDFMLASDYILGDSARVTIVPGSYYALGQDGSYYNQDMNVTNNSAVPTGVAQALYMNSDHLPVTLKLKVGGPIGTSVKQQTKGSALSAMVTMPDNKTIRILIKSSESMKVAFNIWSLHGQLMHTEQLQVQPGESVSNLSFESESAGMYILQLLPESGAPSAFRFIR